MKIDGGNGGKRISNADRTKKSASKGVASKSSDSSAKADGDRIDVDGHSESLDAIRQMVADVPDVRMDEVERVMKKLKDGKYHVDYEKIADGFIREALMSELSKKMKTTRGA